VRSMLEARFKTSSTEFVFAGKPGKPILVTPLDHKHAKVRKRLKLREDFVVHSLRHTMLIRLGLLGVDAFTIMRIAGHSSITISLFNQPPRRIGPGVELGIAGKNGVR
jgi:integrase